MLSRKIHPTVANFPLEISFLPPKSFGIWLSTFQERGVTELLRNLNCKRSHALPQFVEKISVNAYVRYLECQALCFIFTLIIQPFLRLQG